VSWLLRLIFFSPACRRVLTGSRSGPGGMDEVRRV